MPADRALRASDADRERVATALRNHTGAGRLTLDELDQRVAAAYAARTLEDLDPLLADLPSSPPTPEPDVTVRAALRLRWAGWLVTGVLCLLIWTATSLAASDFSYFWPGWVIGPWGVVLLAKTLGTRPTKADPAVAARLVGLLRRPLPTAAAPGADLRHRPASKEHREHRRVPRRP